MRSMTVMPIFGLLATLLLVLTHVSAKGDSQARVAIVIGNASYPTAPLRNTRNDAVAMAEALRKLDFYVVTVLDGNRLRIQQAIAQVASRLNERQGIGLLYYSGHGVQLESRNFIVPVDARLTKSSDLLAQGIDIKHVIDSFKEAGTKVNIVILDSCRDNPFGHIGSGAGLAQMDAPIGTFIAFATAPGNVALDGSASDNNGIYTSFLLRELDRPGKNIESVFKKVRFHVRQRTAGRQIPWESTSLEEDFYFDPKGAAPTLDAREAFKQELSHWLRISDSSNKNDFYEYLQSYPTGFFAEKAQANIERLTTEPSVRPIGSQGFAIVPAGRPLFTVGDRFVYQSRDASGTSQPVRDLRVTNVTSSTVELNDGAEIWDWMGNLVADEVGTRITRSPAKVWIPSELFVGKRWRTAYAATSVHRTSTLFWDFHVDAFESITIPAGTFSAYRVVGTSKVSTGATQTETLWINSDDFLILKDVWARRRATLLGTGVEASYSRELVQMTRARR